MDWEFEISRGKLLYIGEINSKVLLYSTGNNIQYLVINHNGKEYEKECMYVCVYIYIAITLLLLPLNHFSHVQLCATP